jgi:hypothetical protein
MKKFFTPFQTLRYCWSVAIFMTAVLFSLNVKSQCTTVAADNSHGNWAALSPAPTCAQQGPFQGQGAGSYIYYATTALSNCYMDFYLATSGTVTCANTLYYTTGDVGPVGNSLNQWATTLAPAGTNYVKCTVNQAGAWNGGSTVLYYKYATPGTPTASSMPSTACINTAQTYTVNNVGSTTTGTSATSYFVWSVTGVAATYSATTTGTSNTITFTGSGTATVTVYASNNGVCNSATLSQAVTVYAASTAGSPSVAAVDFCAGSGDFTTPITVSGQTGSTYQWYYRSNTGGAGTTNAWVTTAASGTCCFPIETSPTDGQPNGIAYTIKNGVCPATAISAWIPIRNSNTVTPTLSVTGGVTSTTYSYCSTSAPASITLTANFSSVPSTWGTIKWYAGTCGSGTLLSTTTLTGTTAVNNYSYTVLPANFPAAGSAQTYYAMYAPPATSGGCSNLCSNAVTVTNVTTPSGASLGAISYCASLGSGVMAVSGGAGATQYAWGVPAGLSGSSTGSSIGLIGSTPGTYTVSVTPQDVAGGITCSGSQLTNTVTVYATQTMSLTGGLASPTLCQSTALGTNTVYTFGGGATSAGITAGSLPTGMSGAVVGSTFVISGTPSVSGSFPYTITTSGAGGCSPVSLGGTITVNATQTMTLASGSASPTLCQSTTLGTNTVYSFGGGATTAGISAGALPAGMSGTVIGSTFVIAGTPSVSGSFPYTVTSSGTGSCSPVSLGGTITVNGTQTMSLTGGSASPSVCRSSALGTNTVFTFGGGATSASISAGALPAGMSGSVVGSTFVISGTPTVAGSFAYTVTSSGSGSCSPVSLGGTITVNNIQTMSLTGGSATPSICKSSALGTNTVYTFGGGATTASITAGALPAGMLGSVVGSTFVISGTPSVAGSFAYTVTSSGAGSCSPVSLGGTITVYDLQSMSLTGGSASPTLCKSTLLGTNTVYTFGGGATSASITAGSLPAGMSGSVVGSTFVIAGTPSASGSFAYTVTSSGAGSCSPVDLGGTITVNATPIPTFTTVPGSPICNYTNATYTTQAGQSSYVWSGFGAAGVDYNIIAGGLGSTDNTVTLQWIGTGTKAVSVSYSTVSCAAATSASNSTVVNGSPTPTVSTSGAFCTSNSVVYSTQSGQSSYLWTATGSPGVDYNVISGGGSTNSTYTIQWITAGSKTVTANYTNGSGCPGPAAGSTTNTVTVGPTSAALSDVIDGCNGGHTATVTFTGGTSPYNFTVCGTPYTNRPSPAAIDATSNTTCSLTLVSDANGCAPGTISGSPVTYPARTLTAGDTYACTVSTGATKVFYDNSGNLMVKITDGGGTLGATTVVASVDGAVQQFGLTNPQSYLQRHFKISPTNTSGSASVCLYLSDAEVAALNTASASDNHSAPSYYATFLNTLSNAVVTKFHGAAETPVSNVSRQVLTPTGKTHNPTVNGVTYNNVWEVCMNVSSWSGFYVHAQNTNNTPLPVTLLYLTADAINNKYIQLDWATASEINNQGFEVQRSTDGVSFERLAWVDGHGTSNSTLYYSSDDRTAQPGVVYYYRLKQVDIDGHFVYTEIVSASLIGDKGFVFEDLIPNPAINTVQLGILTTTGQKAEVTITDMLGRVVLNNPWQLSEGYNISTFDISSLAEGTYNVTVYSGTTYSTKRLVVTK